METGSVPSAATTTTAGVRAVTAAVRAHECRQRKPETSTVSLLPQLVSLVQTCFAHYKLSYLGHMYAFESKDAESGDAMAALGHRSLEEHAVERQLEYPRDELTLSFVGVLRTAAPALKANHSSADSTDTNSNARPVALKATAASKHKLGGGLGTLNHLFSIT